jgi:large subunit ribosomal protein L19e
MKTQRRLAADILGVSKKHVKFDPDSLEDIKQAITRRDVKELINDGVIMEKHHDNQSRGRARHTKKQKSKGRQRNTGSVKSGKGARQDQKEAWMNKIRSQRTFIKSLKENDKITNSTYRDLYNKAKGGYFRSKRHIKLYLEQNNLFTS